MTVTSTANSEYVLADDNHKLTVSQKSIDAATNWVRQMKYKVGDLVRIRKDLSDKDAYVSPPMANNAGADARITHVDAETYLLDIDGGYWNWTDEMLEDVDEDADADDKKIRPDYYKFHGYDVFDIADCFGLSFPLGNAIKYILRAGKKDKAKEVEDLRKCIRCIEKHIELMEGKAND